MERKPASPVPSVSPCEMEQPRGRNAPTNTMAHVSMSVVKLAAIRDEHAVVGSARYPNINNGSEYAAIRHYFEGVAERERHDLAANMTAYLCQRVLVSTSGTPVIQGQRTLVAARSLPAFEVLGMYGGRVVTALDQQRAHTRKACIEGEAAGYCDDYVWETMRPGRETEHSGASTLLVLGAHEGNALRFMNSAQKLDTFGITKNVGITCVWWKDAPRIVYFTLRAIKLHAELFTVYGGSFNFGSHPIVPGDEEDDGTGAAVEYAVEIVKGWSVHAGESQPYFETVYKGVKGVFMQPLDDFVDHLDDGQWRMNGKLNEFLDANPRAKRAAFKWLREQQARGAH